MIDEEWLPISGYEGRYEVSNLGAVRSLPRKTPSRWGNLKTSPGGVLKPHLMKIGYARVDLSDGHGKKIHKLVHRLVAIAFLPAVEGKNNVNHLDSNRTNNRADNLEWCTHKENTAHMMAKGRSRFTLQDPEVRAKARESKKLNRQTIERKAWAKSWAKACGVEDVS